MRVPALPLYLALWLAVGCATSGPAAPRGATAQARAPAEDSPPSESSSESPGAGDSWQEPSALLYPEGPGRLRLSFPASAPGAALPPLSLEEARPLRAAFDSFRPRLRLRLLESPSPASSGLPAWERRLREDFLSLYGPSQLPLPPSLQDSRLALALQRSALYMDEGFRQAAQELFSSPAFLASVALSVGVYFAAWLFPEPFFSKAFAATLTVRLALLVGLVELAQLAHACLRLHREAEAAHSPQALEAAAERFGRALGATGLRVLVVVASLGVPQVLPKVPQGGLWTLLSPLRHAPAGGPALESVATAQVMADGTLVVTGVASGTLASSASSFCGELASCAVAHGSGSRLSTRYGKPHTRENPPHNEAIEQELARREASGHVSLRKNKQQLDVSGKKAFDQRPGRTTRFRKPDASSIRPDGVRHNTNYVSNRKDLKRELEAFDAMVAADKSAIHELYQLDGTLVRRFVPPGVSFP